MGVSVTLYFSNEEGEKIVQKFGTIDAFKALLKERGIKILGDGKQ